MFFDSAYCATHKRASCQISELNMHTHSRTCQDGQSPHGGERVVPRCIQYVQLIYVPLNAVHFPVKILNGRRVLLLEPSVQEPGNDCRFSHFGGSQNHHPVTVLRWDGEIALARRHFLNHSWFCVD